MSLFDNLFSFRLYMSPVLNIILISNLIDSVISSYMPSIKREKKARVRSKAQAQRLLSKKMCAASARWRGQFCEDAVFYIKLFSLAQRVINDPKSLGNLADEMLS